MNSGPIILVDDDEDDCELLKESFERIGAANEIRCFVNGCSALQHLKNINEKIFLIVSDINMPIMNGLQLKQAINDDELLKKRAIPFIFLSTAVTPFLLNEAARLSAQGFFKKPSNTALTVQTARAILDYWRINMMLH